MTFLFKGHDFFAESDFMAELCPIHWEICNGQETLHDQHGLVAVATLVSLDGDLCHIPCETIEVTDLARKLSGEKGIALPALECKPFALLDNSVPGDWDFRVPLKDDGKFCRNMHSCLHPHDVDLVWMKSPMPPPGTAIALDVNGQPRSVVVAPRLIHFVDLFQEPKGHFFQKGVALVGVLAITHRLVRGDTNLMRMQRGRDGLAYAHAWPLTRRVPADLPAGVDDVYAHLGPDDDDFDHRAFACIEINPELATAVCCERVGFGNEYSTLLLERARERKSRIESIRPSLCDDRSSALGAGSERIA